MPRPDRGYRSEISTDQPRYTQSVPEKLYWQNEFRFVTRLLEQKLLNFIRLNERLRENIPNLTRFVQVSESEISFNLVEFKENYQLRFIIVDFETYCKKFLEIFTPLLTDFLKEIRYGAYTFTFKLRLGSNTFEKIKTVLIQKNEE
jgi:hypothetical protein